MARLDVQAAWEHSWFFGFLLRVWEGSIFYRMVMAVVRWIGRIGPDTWTGRVWLSDWPAGPAFTESVTGRALLGLNRWVARVTRPLSAFMAGTWESSFVVRAGAAVVRWVGPLLGSSWVFQSVLGYAGDTELAPAESTPARPVSPLLPALGAVLGLLALIPSPDPGQGGLNPTILMVLGIWGVAGLWLLQKLMTRDFTWRASSVFVPLAVFLVLAVASALTSVDRAASLQNLLLWFTAALLFLLVVNLVRSSRDVAAFMGPIMAAAVLMALWSLYQLNVPPEVTEAWVDPEMEKGLVRTFAGMNNPNYLALYMELFIPVVVALWIHQPKRRLELTGIMGAMAVALLLTQSRAGWLGLAVAGVTFILLRAARWSFLLVLGALAVWQVLPESMIDRIRTAFDPTHTSNVYRGSIRIGVLRTVRENWLFGTGLGAKAFSDVYATNMMAAARAAHAHHTFLEMLGETGIFGFAAVVWTLAAALKRTIAAGVDRLRSPVPAAVASAIIAVLVHGTAEHIWYNPKILFSFWAVVGLGMGLVLGDKEGAKS
jgi:putative inorganic carbon (hco3(-)) transporter